MHFLQKNWGGLAALAKKVIQKQVIEKYRLSARVKKLDSPCVHLTLTPHPISTKRSYGCLSSLCSQKIVDSSHLCLTLTHHAILTKNKTKKTDHRDRWAHCAHKKYCVHLIYDCLSQVIQFSKKIQIIGACGLAAFEKIITFVSFTFDFHPLCNFSKKQVIGEGWSDVLAKNNLNSSHYVWLSGAMQFLQKKIIEIGGPSMFTKTCLNSSHLLFD